MDPIHFLLGPIRLDVLHHATQEPVFGLERTREPARHGYDLGPGTMDPLLHAVDVLAQHGVLDDTLVVLTADHGESLDEHGIFFSHNGLYEPTIHAPLVLRVPGDTTLRRRVPDTVGLVDLMPTLAELRRVPAPAGLDGRSLVPLARGEAVPPRPVLIVGRTGHIGTAPHSGIRTREAKYVRGPDGREELYRLAVDPAEAREAAGSAPELLESARSAWRRLSGVGR